MATSDNLILGAAKLYVAAAGTGFNPSTDFDAVNWELDSSVVGDWTDLGHTTTGVTLNNAPEFVKATSQQAMRTLDVGITDVTTTVATTLREITAERLGEIVAGSGFDAGSVHTTFPGGKGKAQKFALLMWGPGPEDKPVFLAAPRCYYSGDRSVTFGNDEFASTEVEIEVLDNGAAAPFSIYVVTPA